jgi:tetratricopeptide (TPR) repeat protein
MPVRKRLFALAQELRVETRVLLQLSRQHGLDVKNQLSHLTAEQVSQLTGLVQNRQPSVQVAVAPALSPSPQPQEDDEEEARCYFRELKRKFHAESFEDDSPVSRLAVILMKLDSEDCLETEEIAWLERKNLSETLRDYYAWAAARHERIFEEFDDLGSLASASSCWRSAGKPEKALAATGRINLDAPVSPAQLHGALLTTRGGACRDLGQLAEAVRLGLKAVKVAPWSFQPYMLLGAVFYQMGDPHRGDEYFAQAIERGAKEHAQEAEIRRAVEESGEEEQRAVARYLLNKDAVKYSWAKKYLQEGPCQN